MAQQLIDSLTRNFDPTVYRDEYREDLLALIERKAGGEEIVTAPATEAPKPTRAPDLMAALEQSIAAVKNGGAKAKARKPARAKSKAAPKRAPRTKSKSTG
jgi:DNA end-binding protein Ku